MLGRGVIVDTLFQADECLVLLEHECLRLTAVAAAVVGLLDRPRTSEGLRAHLEDVFGPAPDGRLEQVLAELVQQGVVVETDPDRSVDP